MNPKAKQDINSLLVEAATAIEGAREILESATVGDPVPAIVCRLLSDLYDTEDKLAGVMFKVQRL